MRIVSQSSMSKIFFRNTCDLNMTQQTPERPGSLRGGLPSLPAARARGGPRRDVPEQGGDVQDQRHPAVAEDGRAGDARDTLEEPGERLYHRPALAVERVDHEAAESPFM